VCSFSPSLTLSRPSQEINGLALQCVPCAPARALLQRFGFEGAEFCSLLTKPKDLAAAMRTIIVSLSAAGGPGAATGDGRRILKRGAEAGPDEANGQSTRDEQRTLCVCV
jgi:hypothetical protein